MMPSTAAAPAPTTIHSAARHAAGRYLVRIESRPPKSTAAHAIAVPAARSGKPATLGELASSNTYTAIVIAIRPVTTLAATKRRRVIEIAPRRPKPRESIAAASSMELPSAPSRTGNATPSHERRPVDDRPRNRRALRTRAAALASCGANDSATVIATPASYSAAGRARSKRRGLANAFADPTHTSKVAS